jgi:hypothetical protein
MKITINQTQIEFPTFKYEDIKEEGWYQCGNWTLLFLRNEIGIIFPVLACDGVGRLRPVSREHNWDECRNAFRKVPFSLTISN